MRDIPEWVRKRFAPEPITVDDLADAIDGIFDAIDALIEQAEESEAHMGAFDEKANIVIPNPDGGKASGEFCKKHGKDATAEQEFRKKWSWDDHEQIIIRGSFTVADQEEMENASSTLEGKGKKRNLKVKTGSARRTLLERMIVSWTLTRNGQIMPVTSETISQLPANYRQPVLEKCDEIARTMDEDEQEDFLPSVNGHMKGD